MSASLQWAKALHTRFGGTLDDYQIGDTKLLDEQIVDLVRIVERGSCREFSGEPLPLALLQMLAATALSAPTKSDLQQADVIIVQNGGKRAALAELVPSMPWIATCPAFLVFCGNNRRIRQIAEARGHAFNNDHLDAFFNAAIDAGIVLATFVIAAEAAGLGCCPVSVLRNHSARVSEILNLPDHVFAVAGLAAGMPARRPSISPRLGLDTTVHIDQYTEDMGRIEAYDRRRQEGKPIRHPRRPDLFTEVAQYGWSEDKARQYALPERADFGAFIRAKGFRLD